MESDLQRLNSGQVFASRGARIVPSLFRAPLCPIGPVGAENRRAGAIGPHHLMKVAPKFVGRELHNPGDGLVLRAELARILVAKASSLVGRSIRLSGMHLAQGLSFHAATRRISN
jgi:hypothetical protein